MKTFCLLFALFLQSCTYSINMVHTEGSASDVVDDTEATDANPELSLVLDPTKI